MGETSYKSMRGAAMEDVIFAGSQQRPARNTAEVTLFIDNSTRTAPAEFNDADDLEVTRRIEREIGSAYRVNGKDARARDIRLLFEDAATGARSPALVRQGRIGEIVNAAPQERRRLLEDAAGIAGLHSRRHEAELRLKATESQSRASRRSDRPARLATPGAEAPGPPGAALPSDFRQDPRDRGITASSPLGFGLRARRAGRSRVSVRARRDRPGDQVRRRGAATTGRGRGEAPAACATRRPRAPRYCIASASSAMRLSAKRPVPRRVRPSSRRGSRKPRATSPARKSISPRPRTCCAGLARRAADLRRRALATVRSRSFARLPPSPRSALATAETAFSAATEELARARAERRRIDVEQTELEQRIALLERQSRRHRRGTGEARSCERRRRQSRRRSTPKLASSPAWSRRWKAELAAAESAEDRPASG